MRFLTSLWKAPYIKRSAYCCFLPDLTRFTASYCAGPKPCKRSHQKAIHTVLLYSFYREPSRGNSSMTVDPCTDLTPQQIQIFARFSYLQLKYHNRFFSSAAYLLIPVDITSRSADHILPPGFIQIHHRQEFIQRRIGYPVFILVNSLNRSQIQIMHDFFYR